MSAFTRTSDPPISISTSPAFPALGSSDPRRPTFDPFRPAARRHAKSCDGEISSERATAEMFAPGSTDAADRPFLEVVGPAPALADRRALKPLSYDLDELVRVSSGHRRRHRSCYPCRSATIRAPRAARMVPAIRLRYVESASA